MYPVSSVVAWFLQQECFLSMVRNDVILCHLHNANVLRLAPRVCGSELDAKPWRCEDDVVPTIVVKTKVKRTVNVSYQLGALVPIASNVQMIKYNGIVRKHPS